jgi:class 3 adenylate cyclase
MDASRSLREVQSEHYCRMCEANFTSVLDQNVAITFSLNEGLAVGGLPEPPARAMLSDDDTRAVELFTLHAFRELFPDDVLPTDESLRVADISVMFTDIRGSTQLYERLGDSRAYRLVRDHFAVLFDVVEEQRGAVVKTIGDSVMAAFRDPVDALRAAVGVQGNLALFNRRQQLHEGDIIVRVGLDRGPAISVNLNDRLDFFGNTINRVSRIERLSHGNDVVFGAELQTDPRVQRFLVEHGERLAIERFEQRVKGLERPIVGFRLTAPREVELPPPPRRR